MGQKHWVFKKHTNNIKILTEVALYLKANKAGISKKEKEKMYKEFQKTSLYNPRKSLRDEPLDAINHKLDGLKYFMFGYSDKVDGDIKFIFSPLGNLFLKYISEEEKLSKIFATMLIGMQFPHPFSKPSEEFFLYPFRLIFQLLLEPKLNGKLYNYEVVRFLIYVDKMNLQTYTELVDEILESRAETDTEKFEYLKNNENTLTKSVYEWQYYMSSILDEIKIIEKNSGTAFIDMYHPRRKGSKTETKRKANNGFFSLTETVKPIVRKLLEKYTIYDTPLRLNNSKKKSNDITKEIYSFYPFELLEEIDEAPDRLEMQLLDLPKLIEEYSHNPNNETSDKFEDVLEEAFNMFINVDASKISGAGQTDIECLYLTIQEKFAVEAKSTANKLGQINAGRLKRHRGIIGAEYTLVITPRYTPSVVKYDIKDENIVILKANTLSEYLYNNIVAHNRKIDYGEIQNIVVSNYGTDISEKVSELTLSKFG